MRFRVFHDTPASKDEACREQDQSGFFATATMAGRSRRSLIM